MKSPVFSFLAVIIFALTLVGTMNVAEKISRETALHDYRMKFHVEPRTSEDGIFTTVLCAHTPTLGGNIWVPNRTRSLRALLVQEKSNEEHIIYIEQAQPRMCYELHGKDVLQNADEVYWASPTTIGLKVVASSTSPIEYLIDVQTLTSTHHPFDQSDHQYRQLSAPLYID